MVDVNEALVDVDLDGKIIAMASGPRLVFQAVKGSGSNISTITAGGTAVTELGLRGSQDSVLAKGGVPTIEAPGRLPLCRGRTGGRDGERTLLSYRSCSGHHRYSIHRRIHGRPVVSIGYNATVVYVDVDGNHLVGHNRRKRAGRSTRNQYDAAMVTGVLTLTHVEGIFYTAEWLQAEGTPLYAYHSPGEAAPGRELRRLQLRLLSKLDG